MRHRPGLFPTSPPPVRPLLKWVGGKTWLAPAVNSVYKHHRNRRLAEEFCGGLGIASYLRAERALLNDVNPHLINLYRQIQNGLEPYELSPIQDSERYHRYRKIFNARISRGKIRNWHNALLFYYLMRTGFNGLCRFNRKGEFNVSYGKTSSNTLVFHDSFDEYRELFRDWTFTCGDFRDVPVERGDFRFADPPYDDQFVGYTGLGFTWDDQVDLAERLGKHKGPVMATNNPTPRILKLYKSLGFKAKRAPVMRRVSCAAETRGVVSEVVFFKNL